MKKGQDITVTLPNIVLIHQKVPGRELAQHSHKEHEFFIPLQGEIKVSFSDNKNVFNCGPGRMLYIPPNTEHSFSSSASGQGERMIILIDDKIWKRSTEKKITSSVTPLNSLVKELAYYLLLNPQSIYSKTFTKALIECLIECLSLHRDVSLDDFRVIESKIKDSRVKKAFSLIVESEDDIPVTELARTCGLSPRNLNRLFLSEVGSTPKTIMITKKINLAKELLLTTKMTITDISLEVGYNSLSKFISTFQKYTGSLPSDFRSMPN